MAKQREIPVGISTEQLAEVLAGMSFGEMLHYAGDGSYAGKNRPASYTHAPDAVCTCIRIARRHIDSEFVPMVEEALSLIARDPPALVEVNGIRVDLYYYPKAQADE
jgi:hypothetical protein